LRWGYDVAIDYKGKALEHFREFWDHASPEVRGLTGGADVAILEDGAVTIIEFNFGNDSAFVDAQKELIPANQFLSALLGRPTPLIEKLEALVHADERAQSEFLTSTIPRAKGLKEENRSLRDMYLPDAFQYLRDRMIEEWLNSPSAAAADALTARFRYLADQQLSRIEDEAFRREIAAMADFGTDYLRERLSRSVSEGRRPELVVVPDLHP
jgi:hypothetical protein